MLAQLETNFISYITPRIPRRRRRRSKPHRKRTADCFGATEPLMNPKITHFDWIMLFNAFSRSDSTGLFVVFFQLGIKSVLAIIPILIKAMDVVW